MFLVRVLLVLPLAVSVAVAQTPLEVAVDATVCGPDGEPLAGVQFGDFWTWRDSVLVPRLIMDMEADAQAQLTSDKNGKVRGHWTQDPLGAPLLALSLDRRFAAFVLPRFNAAHKAEVTGKIVLLRAVKLRLELRAPRVRGAFLPLSWEFFWTQDDVDPFGKTRPRQCFQSFKLSADRAEIPLPPRRYKFRLRSFYNDPRWRTVVLEAGRDSFDLGTITPNIPPLELLDEVLPNWHVDAARNIELADASLGHFRGKPLLVHFHFTDRYLFRDDRATRAALAALASHPRKAGFGVVLFDLVVPAAYRDGAPPEPDIEEMFPIVGDSSGKTCAIYGRIREGAILLDRDGKLLACGRLEKVIEELERLLR